MVNWPSTLHIGGVCHANNLHFFKKYSLRIFILVPDNQPGSLNACYSHSLGNVETFHFLLQQLNKHGWVRIIVCSLTT